MIVLLMTDSLFLLYFCLIFKGLFSLDLEFRVGRFGVCFSIEKCWTTSFWPLWILMRSPMSFKLFLPCKEVIISLFLCLSLSLSLSVCLFVFLSLCIFLCLSISLLFQFFIVSSFQNVICDMSWHGFL